MIVYGNQNVNCPENITFGQYMLDQIRFQPGNNVCLENGVTRETMTNKELTQYIVNLTVRLSKLGVRKGDVVAIGSEPFLRYIPTALAVTRTGAVCTYYELVIGEAMLKHKMSMAKPNYFIYSSLFRETYQHMLKNFDCIEMCIAISDIPEMHSLKSLASEEEDVESIEPNDVQGKTDTAFIFYSSGTTGMAKGVEAEIIFANPVHIRDLVNSGMREDHLDSVKEIVSVAFPLRAGTIQTFRERLPHVENMYQQYGLTECGPVATGACVPIHKPGSVGMASPGMIIKVLDPDTRAILGPNQHGEIWVKGPTVMKGYIDNDPSEYFDEEGFYKTGDIGYFDDEQCFYIVDRISFTIFNKFTKVYPVDVEDVILQHPAVMDAGVVGKPDAVLNEVPAVFVVKRPGCDVTESELMDFVATKVSPPMQLKGGVRFIQEIPRNDTGKILRRQLKIMLE